MNCNKECYTTRRQARTKAKEMTLKYRIKYRVYLCDTCKNFHLSRVKEDAMDIEECAKILKEYNYWRTGGDSEMLEPKLITMAISGAIMHIEHRRCQHPFNRVFLDKETGLLTCEKCKKVVE